MMLRTNDVRRSQQHSVHQHIQSSVENPPTRKRKTVGRHRMPTSGVLQQNENRHRGRFQRKHRRPKPRKQRKQPTGRPGGLQRPFWSGENQQRGRRTDTVAKGPQRVLDIIVLQPQQKRHVV